MLLFKRYIVIIILTVFALGAVASTAMAHCGHNSFSVGDTLIMETPDHNDKAEATCDAHDHGSASLTSSASGHNNDHSANQVDCNDCSGVPCQSKIQVTDAFTPAQCIDVDEIHSQDTIFFKNIFLSIIPNPPNSIS